MTTQLTQADKAEFFRNQHRSGKLLLLPNIWDPLGAKLMEKAGYHSIATASVATALSNGYLDGEKIPFVQLLNAVDRITAAVSLPLTVDIERGFADSLLLLKENIRLQIFSTIIRDLFLTGSYYPVNLWIVLFKKKLSILRRVKWMPTKDFLLH